MERNHWLSAAQPERARPPWVVPHGVSAPVAAGLQARAQQRAAQPRWSPVVHPGDPPLGGCGGGAVPPRVRSGAPELQVHSNQQEQLRRHHHQRRSRPTFPMEGADWSTPTDAGAPSPADSTQPLPAQPLGEATAAAAPPPAAINTQVPKGSGGLVQINRRKRAGTRRFNSATASAAARGSSSGTSSQRFMTVFELLPPHLANGAAAPGRSRTDQGCVAP